VTALSRAELFLAVAQTKGPLHSTFEYNFFCIKNRADALTNLPPCKVAAQADAALDARCT
jgi:hypothetical protein